VPGCICTACPPSNWSAVRLYYLVASAGITYPNMGLIWGHRFSGLGEVGSIAIDAPWRSGILQVLGAAVGVVWWSLAYGGLGRLAGFALFIGVGLISGA